MTPRYVTTERGIGRIEGDDVVIVDLPYPDLGAILAAEQGLEAVAGARERDREPLARTVLLAPVPAPPTIYLVGANYHSHLEETGLPVPERPIFAIIPRIALSAPGAPIALPAEAPDHVDYEGELAVVVGRVAGGVRRADAWRHIAAVTICNDVSARDVQLRNLRDIPPAKSYPSFKPLGPALVPVGSLANPDDLGIETRVNGELRQKARTTDLIFDVPAIVEHLSARHVLQPGDVILTGTPAGVGFVTKRFLIPGDVVEVTVEHVGTLRNTVEAAARR
jgi:2-keto-4-pentenoate hydratase/2-oxohepta-3-ene-1,7-dioic acid hydratase in catechol pathway